MAERLFADCDPAEESASLLHLATIYAERSHTLWKVRLESCLWIRGLMVISNGRASSLAVKFF